MLLLTRNTTTNRWEGADTDGPYSCEFDWVYLDNALIVKNSLGQTVIYGNDPATIPNGRLAGKGVPRHPHQDLEQGLFEWATLCEDGTVILGGLVTELTTLFDILP